MSAPRTDTPTTTCVCGHPTHVHDTQGCLHMRCGCPSLELDDGTDGPRGYCQIQRNESYNGRYPRGGCTL